MRYHHVGIPTNEKRPGEVFLEQFGMHVVGFETNPYGVEWLRFEPDSPLPSLVQTVPHVAFVVDDLGEALEGKDILIEPNSPSPGVTVAFIVDNGAPIELMAFAWKNHPLDLVLDRDGEADGDDQGTAPDHFDRSLDSKPSLKIDEPKISFGAP